MADQDSDNGERGGNALVNAANQSLGALPIAQAARKMGQAFGLARAPGEDNDAYAKAYASSNSGD
jgi:hypothetical protein